MADSLESRLQTLTDDLALRKLVAAYTQRGDALDWKGWSELFTEDAVFSIPGAFGTLRGRQEIHDVSKAALGDAYETTQHYIVNLDFEISGDTAQGIGDLIYAALPKKTRPSEYYMAGGHYKWSFARTADGWRIAVANLDFVWNNGAAADSVFADETTSAA